MGRRTEQGRHGTDLNGGEVVHESKTQQPALIPPAPSPPDREKPTDDLESQAVATTRQPRVPDAFPEGEGSVPNNPLIVAGLESMFKGGAKAQALTGGWKPTDTGRPVYIQTSRRGGRIRVYPRLSANPSDPMPTTESLWSFVEGLSAFTADVALAVLAQLCEPTTGDKTKYPLVDSVRITADAILRYKGIRRYGEDRRELERRVYEEMRRLQALTFDVEKLAAPDPDTGRWNSEGASWEEDRLFDIVKVTQYRQGSKSSRREQIEVSWMVRAGQWAQWWLNPQAKVWLARMAHALLELDHRPNSGYEYMAKKLGQRVVLMNQAIRRGEPLPIRIDLLLEKIGELPVPAERGVHWARRTRTRFDEALLSLQEAGVFASVEWPNGHGPGQEDQGRGWVRKWLESKVVVTLPDRAPEPLAERRQIPVQPKKTKAASDRKVGADDDFHGDVIRAARMDRGWSQQALADHIGVSAAWLSNIESGKRSPSEELRSKLTSWLADSPIP